MELRFGGDGPSLLDALRPPGPHPLHLPVLPEHVSEDVHGGHGRQLDDRQAGEFIDPTRGQRIGALQSGEQAGGEASTAVATCPAGGPNRDEGHWPPGSCWLAGVLTGTVETNMIAPKKWAE